MQIRLLRSMLRFDGTDYQNLASHPGAKLAAVMATARFGNSFSGSRVTSGTHDLHLDLEKKLAVFMGRQDAVLASSGQHANQILLEHLVKLNDVIYAQDTAHPSLLSSVPNPQAIQSFSKSDLMRLKQGIESIESAVILVNGVDAVTGEIFPLAWLQGLLNLYPHKNMRVVVDDAHGVFVLGKNGRGSLEHAGISSERFFQTATMSKGLGSFGGFIAGAKKLCDALRDQPAYRSSSSLPPGVLAASRSNLRTLSERRTFGVPFWEKSLLPFVAGLQFLGCTVEFHDPPLINL